MAPSPCQALEQYPSQKANQQLLRHQRSEAKELRQAIQRTDLGRGVGVLSQELGDLSDFRVVFFFFLTWFLIVFFFFGFLGDFLVVFIFYIVFFFNRAFYLFLLLWLFLIIFDHFWSFYSRAFCRDSFLVFLGLPFGKSKIGRCVDVRFWR